MSDDTKVIPLFPETPEQAVVAPMEMTVSEWVEAWRFLEGEPMTFDQQPWLRPLLDCQDQWQVWQAGRQVAKSTSLANLILAFGANISYLRQLYVTPTYKQLRVFSKDRLRDAIMQSPPMMQFLWNNSCADSIEERSLITGSQVFMRSTFLTADSARGLSVHVLLLDEIQDLLIDVIPILEETTSAARRSKVAAARGFVDVRRYCGTPKTFDTAMEEYWSISSQNEWLVPCDHCGGGDYRFWNKLDEKNIGPTGLICKKCGKDIDWGMGTWAVSNPAAKWTGWRISQLMATEPRGWIKWDSILDKQRRYRTHQFFNEVLGLAYDSGMRPITMDELQACCRPGYSLTDASVAPGLHRCFAGLDWAMEESKSHLMSYTVLTIYALIGNRFQLQYVKKFQGFELDDPDFIIQTVLEKMAEYNVQIIGCDRGVGHFENERIRRSVDRNFQGDPSKVLEFRYVSSRAERKFDFDSTCYLLDRTQVMERLFYAMKERKVHFPVWDEFEPFYRDVYGIRSDHNMDVRKTIYVHRDPDDFFHSTLYAWEAMLHFYDYRLSLGPKVVKKKKT